MRSDRFFFVFLSLSVFVEQQQVAARAAATADGEADWRWLIAMLLCSICGAMHWRCLCDANGWLTVHSTSRQHQRHQQQPRLSVSSAVRVTLMACTNARRMDEASATGVPQFAAVNQRPMPVLLTHCLPLQLLHLIALPQPPATASLSFPQSLADSTA